MAEAAPERTEVEIGPFTFRWRPESRKVMIEFTKDAGDLGDSSFLFGIDAGAWRQFLIAVGPDHHILLVDGDGGWFIAHPIACRSRWLHGVECPIHAEQRNLGEPPVGPGRYRVDVLETDQLHPELRFEYERLEDE